MTLKTNVYALGWGVLCLFPVQISAQTEQAVQFLENLGKLFNLATLAPEALEKTADIHAALKEKREIFLPQYNQINTFSIQKIYPGVSTSSSTLVYDSKGEKTGLGSGTLLLFIPVQGWPTCIAKSDLVAKFGKPDEQTRFQPMRVHGAGTGPFREEFRYKTEYGLQITFVFDDPCATYVRVLDRPK